MANTSRMAKVSSWLCVWAISEGIIGIALGIDLAMKIAMWTALVALLLAVSAYAIDLIREE